MAPPQQQVGRTRFSSGSPAVLGMPWPRTPVGFWAHSAGAASVRAATAVGRPLGSTAGQRPFPEARRGLWRVCHYPSKVLQFENRPFLSGVPAHASRPSVHPEEYVEVPQPAVRMTDVGAGGSSGIRQSVQPFADLVLLNDPTEDLPVDLVIATEAEQPAHHTVSDREQVGSLACTQLRRRDPGVLLLHVCG